VGRRGFNNMIMVLDRYFVHRLRMVTGKDSGAAGQAGWGRAGCATAGRPGR
jgi:hypothetical protein